DRIDRRPSSVRGPHEGEHGAAE
ncbi:MAG: hypothetical protein AVDCRST_MAG19-4106, partial [uncultured Thermomicrobiales bacterium]